MIFLKKYKKQIILGLIVVIGIIFILFFVLNQVKYVKIGLSSPLFFKFKIIDESELSYKNIYILNYQNNYLKIEQKILNKSDADNLQKYQELEIESAFLNMENPYPGQISNQIVCSDKFKPQKYSLESASYSYLITYSNNRFGEGICNQDSIKYKQLIMWIYCEDQNSFYTIKYFINKKSSYKNLHNFVKNIKCN